MTTESDRTPVDPRTTLAPLLLAVLAGSLLLAGRLLDGTTQTVVRVVLVVALVGTTAWGGRVVRELGAVRDDRG